MILYKEKETQPYYGYITYSWKKTPRNLSCFTYCKRQVKYDVTSLNHSVFKTLQVHACKVVTLHTMKRLY